MPIYEYICQNCNKEFEKIVLTINNKQADTLCPSCNGLAKRKEVYAAGCNGQFLVFSRVGS